MGLVICSAVVLCIFFQRDVLLLGCEKSCAHAKLALYSAVTLTCLVLAVRLWHSLSPDQALQLVRSPWTWCFTLIVHAALWRAVAWLKRRPGGKARMWLIAVLPAPMLILCMVAISQRLSNFFSPADGFAIGSTAAAVWVIAVVAAATVFRKSCQVREEDKDFVASWAEIASWTGFGVLPFTGVLQFAEILLKYD